MYFWVKTIALKIIAMIPARYDSKRLPGKLMMDLNGKSVIKTTLENIVNSNLFDAVYVVTDSQIIYDHLKQFHQNILISNNEHISGSDRIAEFAQEMEVDIIINIQGDEPLIDPNQITQIITSFSQGSEKIITLAKKITSKEAQNTNTVKVNFNSDMIATNFYRSANKDTSFLYKHIGVYGFKQDTLDRICRLDTTENELKHKLEQLRWLDNNYKIKVVVTEQDSISIDTQEDLDDLLKHHSEKLT